MFIIHYNALLTFESVDKVLNCDSLGPDSLEEENGEWTEQKIAGRGLRRESSREGLCKALLPFLLPSPSLGSLCSLFVAVHE